MVQFVLKSKKYGDKIVSIDDEDKHRLFKTGPDGKDVLIDEWYLGYVNRSKDFYAFRYKSQFARGKQTLSNFIMHGSRVFFADGNRLNCCRSNFVSRSDIHDYGEPMFEKPECIKKGDELFAQAVSHKEYKIPRLLY